MVDTVTYGNFKTDKKLKEKRQIILCHTSREIGEYLISLKFRNSGKYDKLPHYVLTRDGRLLEILSPNYSSNYLIDKDIKKQHIYPKFLL